MLLIAHYQCPVYSPGHIIQTHFQRGKAWGWVKLRNGAEVRMGWQSVKGQAQDWSRDQRWVEAHDKEIKDGVRICWVHVLIFKKLKVRKKRESLSS